MLIGHILGASLSEIVATWSIFNFHSTVMIKMFLQWLCHSLTNCEIIAYSIFGLLIFLVPVITQLL